MTNHLYAQLADDGTTIANVCVVLDVGVVDTFPSGARTLYGIAEAEALGWAWLGPEDQPYVDPGTGQVPEAGWTATQTAVAVLKPGQPALATPEQVQEGGVVAPVAPTPATWQFAAPAVPIIEPPTPAVPAVQT